MNTITIICAIIGAISAVLGGVWFIVNRAFDRGIDKHRLDVVENKTHDADCSGHKNCIDATKETVNALNSDIVEIKKDIAIIKAYLVGESDKASKMFSMKNSPRKLNANGEALFEKINGPRFISEHIDFLCNKIDSKKPTTALDVELFAKEVCIESVDDPIFKEMKDFVYNSPSIKIKDENNVEQDYDLTMNDICFILSLPLRNIYLLKNPGINPE